MNIANIADLLKGKKKPIISLEFFPPRDNKAAERFEGVIDTLAPLGPDYVSVTFGAGGSTREGSYQLVDKLKNEKGLNVVAYLAGYGIGPDDITSILNNYQQMGIETIFAIRGDAPRDAEGFTPHPESFSYASDLLVFIKKNYQFCLGAAGYPEGHCEAESKEKDLEYLKGKVNSGAQYIVSQYFYDNRYFYDFLDRCQGIGINNTPILAGVMPIYSVKMMEALARLCGATITNQVREGLSKISPDDKKAVAAFGVDLATAQCKDLIKKGVRGLHFYTMNRSASVIEIIRRLKEEEML